MADHDRGAWQDLIHELAGIERPSASEGERRAAELVARRLQAAGFTVEVEQERAHGGYWWPVGLLNAAAAAAGLLTLRGKRPSSRIAGAALAAACALTLWDELGHGRRRFRRLLPRRPTWNVVASGGDPAGRRTVALVAHHDAAHSGLVFHPALARLGPRLAPRMHERAHHTLPILYGVWLGPVLVAAGATVGARRLTQAGMAVALGAVAAMADIGRSEVVPGANDNLSAVGALVAVADRLAQRPVDGLRVLLISTGSEESFSEGMQAFGERHFAELDPERTEFLCLECLGGSKLIVLEAEGMLRMREYPLRMREALAAAANAAGVKIARGIRSVAATDAVIALRAGYQAATLASIEDTKLPLNYHWPTDTPDALHWETIEDAIATCESFLRLAGDRPSAAQWGGARAVNSLS